jgi:hypothetical protein
MKTIKSQISKQIFQKNFPRTYYEKGLGDWRYKVLQNNDTNNSENRLQPPPPIGEIRRLQKGVLSFLGTKICL